jgi:hypothetical protein
MNRIILQGKVADERLRAWEADRGDWQTQEEDGEALLALPNNQTVDWRGGTVALAGDPTWRDYEYSLELCVPAGASEPTMAWPGVVVRAQDTDNYELFCFMPQVEDDTAGNVAYLSVAHNMVPWWTDGYVSIPRGRAPYSPGEWLPISVRVEGLQASVRVRNRAEPILTVRLTYYLDGGRVGVYCGTQTSAKFRRMRIDLLDPQPIPDPPELAPSR